MSETDGDTAFHAQEDDTLKASYCMSLRDYFAIHCDQPGRAEIVTAAGLELSDNGQVLPPLEGEEKGARASYGFFDKWYQTLSQQERMQLYAKVRYQLADAMLAEREKAGQNV